MKASHYVSEINVPDLTGLGEVLKESLAGGLLKMRWTIALAARKRLHLLCWLLWWDILFLSGVSLCSMPKWNAVDSPSGNTAGRFRTINIKMLRRKYHSAAFFLRYSQTRVIIQAFYKYMHFYDSDSVTLNFEASWTSSPPPSWRQRKSQWRPAKESAIKLLW